MTENHQSRLDNTFRAALLLSMLIHLVVMLYLKLPDLVAPMRAKATLSVILAMRQEAGQPTAEPPPSEVTPVMQPPPEAIPQPPQEVIKQEVPLPMATKLPLTPAPESEAVSEQVSKPVPGETLQEVPADPVEASSQIVEAGKVQALLLVNERGTVTQVIWKVLPAITDETLQRMEQHLRAKGYITTGKPYTVYEIVEIPKD